MNVLPRRDRRLNRRGESTIIANLIIFIAVMAMAGALVFVFKSMVDSSTNAAVDAKTQSVGVMQTNFVISSAAYVSATSQVWIYVKNTGKQPFDPDTMDLYLDGIRIPRDAANRTVLVTTDTDLTNSGIWDINEELQFNVSQSYGAPTTHTVAVWSPNGVSASGSFSS